MRRLLIVLAIVSIYPAYIAAQEPLPTDPVYRAPPGPIASIADAAPTPSVSLSPERNWMVLMSQPSLPPISELAEEELRLAGVRIKPATNGPSRGFYFDELAFKEVPNGTERAVSGLPADPRISDVRWSPDGRRLAFLITLRDRIELWTADVSSGRAERVTDRAVNDAYGSAFHWLPDSRTLAVKLVLPERGMAPVEIAVPTGPVVQQNLGEVTPARTYQDLLENPHDEELFDYYFAGQLAYVDLEGAVTEVGEPGIVASFDPSPDGRFLVVEKLHRPYSYQVPASRFPRLIEVWNRSGETVHTVADLPLADNIPIGFGSVAEGPRSVGWRADAAATLSWTEARDGGDIMTEAEIRDEVFLLDAPFDGEPQSLAMLENRYGGVSWGTDEVAIVWDWYWRTRRQTGTLVSPGAPGEEGRVLFDYSFEDRYNNPGSPLTETTGWGTSVLRISDGHIFLRGSGASDEGDRPFLDRMALASGETERLWRAEGEYYEWPVDLIDESELTLLTRRESKEDPPNYFMREVAGGELMAVTDFPHPYPQLIGVSKELVRYERADGVSLSGTLYLPTDYAPDQGPLPTLMWAYPTEYKSADAAGQVQGSPHRFDRVGWWSPLFWVVRGYAVFDDPSMPIIGEGDEEPNDTFVQQLVSGAQAAVDVLADRGITDPDRVAIGGHSYGAFMTANLLAHSDLFRAGIARSGAYNRTLTPFGFQAEERKFWEAPEVYFAMSPFMHADKVDEPLLMIHGEADNNSGTFPMQSERMYAAIKGLGGTARLVMLPYESHGYRARESIMHMLWEMTEWLDRYVMDAAPREELTQ